MDAAKKYTDSDGNECSIWQIVRREPEWAAYRIQAGEEALAKVAFLEDLLKVRDGGAHDEDCKINRGGNYVCNCYHDAVVKYFENHLNEFQLVGKGSIKCGQLKS